MKNISKILVFMILAMCSIAAGELNLYTSRHYPVDKEILKDFEKESGIKVNLVYIKKASQLIERLKIQKEKAGADIILTVDVGNLWKAASYNLLQPLNMKEIDSAIPSHLKDKNDLWAAISVRARVLAVNKSKIDPSTITTYEQLNDEKYKDKILIRSSSNVYNQSLIASMVANNGEAKTSKWLKGFAKNFARKPQGGDRDQLRAMGNGQGAIAVVNSYYAGKMWASKKESDIKVMKDVELIFPNQSGRGAHINISGLGIGKYAPNLENARTFIKYMISKKAQKQFAEANFEFPARKDVKITGLMAKFQDMKFDQLSLTKIGENTPKAIKLMDLASWR